MSGGLVGVLQIEGVTSKTKGNQGEERKERQETIRVFSFCLLHGVPAKHEFYEAFKDNLDKVYLQKDAFWCHGNKLKALPTGSTRPVISETFLGIKWKRK